MTEDSGESIRMIEDQTEKEELIAPTIDMKLLVEEMRKTMDKAWIEALTPGRPDSESKFLRHLGLY